MRGAGDRVLRLALDLRLWVATHQRTLPPYQHGGDMIG